MIVRTYRLALLGFGNVGQGFAQILKEQGALLAQRFGAQFSIVAVSDLQKGSVYDPDGLDPAALLAAIQTQGNFDDARAPQRGWDALATIAKSNADIVIELTYTDLRTGEPALTHLRAALQNGKHVVTTNKGPIALAFPELDQLARGKNLEIGVEGTVMSGTPVIRIGREMLVAAGIKRIQGIFNGTTNFILTQMETGASYAAALADAQAKGYAEADPGGDVEGYDAAGKVVILSNLLMDAPLTMTEVDRVGITQLNAQQIAQAQAAGECWKLLGTIERVNGQVRASVRPTRVPLHHPLAAVKGATNAIVYTTELLGDVTVVGPG
ncbi:MAG: homoserine dehydrogenase, partial [Chloroflexota bacterium]